jgi:hypothetical protein
MLPGVGTALGPAELGHGLKDIPLLLKVQPAGAAAAVSSEAEGHLLDRSRFPCGSRQFRDAAAQAGSAARTPNGGNRPQAVIHAIN